MKIPVVRDENSEKSERVYERCEIVPCNVPIPPKVIRLKAVKCNISNKSSNEENTRYPRVVEPEDIITSKETKEEGVDTYEICTPRNEDIYNYQKTKVVNEAE